MPIPVVSQTRLRGGYHHLVPGYSSNPSIWNIAYMTTRNLAHNHASPETQVRSSVASDDRQYLTLRLGAEEYAIDILRVQEIRSFEEPTRMVNAPDFIKGVINLRGVIVPIMDLRLKLRLPSVEYTDFTVVIILNVRGTIVGAVVDAVSDVVTLAADTIRPAPQFDTAIDERFIVGLAQLAQRMLIVMNIEVLMSDTEMGMVKSLAK